MNELAVLPDNPSYLPTTKTIRACVDIFENRDVIVGSLDIEQATEALRRAGAIEKYVSSKEHKDDARRAARILETAVGEALGPAVNGGDRRSNHVDHDQHEIRRDDASRFRLMAEYREQWWPALKDNALSRKKVLTLIDEIRRPKDVGAGTAVIVCAAAKDWLKTAPDADLLLTDPPYSTDVDNIIEFVDGWLSLALAKVKPTGRALIFIGAYADEFAAYFNCPLPEGWRFGVPHAWVYRNTIGPTPEQDFIRNWQCILTLHGPDARPLRSDRITDLLAGFIENAPDGRREVKHHKWQKPQALIERLINITTDCHDTVIDPYAGSGTTLLAAKATGRHAVGCDRDVNAVDTAIARGCHAS